MKLNNKSIALVLGVLVLLIGVTAYFNADGLADKRDAQANALVRVGAEGREAVTFTMDQVRAAGEETFQAAIRSSSRPSSEHAFTGVPLKALIAAAELDLTAGQQVIVRSVDGYVVALNVEEVLQDENIYLVYAMDGEGLGTKEDGGSGPYQVIIRNDPFSQRWSKFVTDVELR